MHCDDCGSTLGLTICDACNATVCAKHEAAHVLAHRSDEEAIDDARSIIMGLEADEWFKEAALRREKAR